MSNINENPEHRFTRRQLGGMAVGAVASVTLARPAYAGDGTGLRRADQPVVDMIQSYDQAPQHFDYVLALIENYLNQDLGQRYGVVYPFDILTRAVVSPTTRTDYRSFSYITSPVSLYAENTSPFISAETSYDARGNMQSRNLSIALATHGGSYYIPELVNLMEQFPRGGPKLSETDFDRALHVAFNLPDKLKLLGPFHSSSGSSEMELEGITTEGEPLIFSASSSGWLGVKVENNSIPLVRESF